MVSARGRLAQAESLLPSYPEGVRCRVGGRSPGTGRRAATFLGFARQELRRRGTVCGRNVSREAVRETHGQSDAGREGSGGRVAGPLAHDRWVCSGARRRAGSHGLRRSVDSSPAGAAAGGGVRAAGGSAQPQQRPAVADRWPRQAAGPQKKNPKKKQTSSQRRPSVHRLGGQPGDLGATLPQNGDPGTMSRPTCVPNSPYRRQVFDLPAPSPLKVTGVPTASAQ